MVKKVFTSSPRLKKEETATLVSASGATPSSTGLYGRLKVLVGIILVGCLVLLVWESLEWDQESGEVQLKIHTGITGSNGIDSSGSGSGSGTGTNDAASASIGTASDAASDTQEQATSKPEPAKPQPAKPEAPKTTPAPTEPASPKPGPAKMTPENQSSNKNCQEQCTASAKDKTKFEGLDLTQAKNMLARLQQFRQQWIDQKLKTDYGKYYQDIFEPLDEENGQRVHVGNQRAFKDPNKLHAPSGYTIDDESTPSVAWQRMIRKYQIKLLQVQLAMIAQQLNPQEYCQQQTTCSSSSSSWSYAKFVWVCGGHSASAGHGNFYHESYTANLGRDLQPILREIGLDWQVKNYAMGGTASGEEVALCFNSLFGRDVDSISWDFGMTDGGDHYKIALYAYRAARLALVEDSVSQPGNVRHRPSLIAIHQNENEHNIVLRNMQMNGMTVLGMDLRYEREKIYPGFPDMFGMNDAQINDLPLYVKYFKCEEKVESGDPGCGDDKFNKTMCNNRHARTSWHPGWKYHALVGHMMAFTVLQVITEALEDLVQQEPTTPETLEQKQTRLQALLQKLDAAEQADYENIFQQPVPEVVLNYFNLLWKGDHKEENKNAMQHLPLQTLIKEPTFCHTAMLPAEIRFQGLLTENPNKVGNVVDQNYEFGAFQTKVVAVESPDPNSGKVPNAFPNIRQPGYMVIGMKDDEHQVCDELINADYKDYFLITSQESWRIVPFPNPSEQKHYTEFDTKKTHGWIFICMAKCDWGHCPNGDIQKNVWELSTDPVFGMIEMEVNLVKVTGVNCMNDCCALKHSRADEHEQQYVWPPRPGGDYEFRARIINNKQWSYARFSSFIIL
ncbi:expressed unknown protein [Seminavis robusta]|uniref:Uncharacterized protein n=1 Tax=Seminavis robusta TaxID=568900 RepID=A0A9N8DIL6_9STRA|nr:expressed unknown protein [Seminavis robusta]|eukprot:Sro173_g076140.1 n/a (845) ;mRNA; r:4383-7333